MRYQLHYHPTVQGRGEFVRLAWKSRHRLRRCRSRKADQRAGDDEIIDDKRSAAAAVCAAVSEAASSSSRRLRISYSISARAEFVAREGRNGFGRTSSSSPSPTSSSRFMTLTIRSRARLYYEEQRPAAKRRTHDFWRYRVPKF